MDVVGDVDDDDGARTRILVIRRRPRRRLLALARGDGDGRLFDSDDATCYETSASNAMIISRSTHIRRDDDVRGNANVIAAITRSCSVENGVSASVFLIQTVYTYTVHTAEAVARKK